MKKYIFSLLSLLSASLIFSQILSDLLLHPHDLFVSIIYTPLIKDLGKCSVITQTIRDPKSSLETQANESLLGDEAKGRVNARATLTSQLT